MPICDDITKFLNIDGNVLLLIKGDPGVGKTILSLEILGWMKYFKGIYFATRDNIDALSAQHPWVKSYLEKNQLFDVQKSVEFEPQEVSAKSALDITTLPKFLKSLYFILLKMKEQARGKTPLIIIDSLEPLSMYLDLPKTLIATQIKKILSEKKAKGILISECSELSEIDFISDGVIVLEQSTVHNRLIRYATVQKLRGISIKKPKYVFSLYNGRFQCFRDYVPPYMQVDLSKILSKSKTNKRYFDEKSGKEETTVSHPYQTIKIGNTHFDGITDGIVNGSCVLFSYSPKIQNYLEGAILIDFMSYFLKKSKFLLYMIDKSFKVSKVTNLFKFAIGKDIVEKQIKFLSLFDKTEPIFKNSRKITLNAFRKYLLNMVEKKIAEYGGMLIILDWTHLISYFGFSENLVKLLTEIKSLISRGHSLIIFKAYYDRETIRQLETIIDYHFRFIYIGKQHFLYSIKPWSHLFHIDLDADGTRIISKLTPIV
ncbi:MAG: RAD55 family ATPase [Candidatus Asgardarchaeia archaeon]